MPDPQGFMKFQREEPLHRSPQARLRDWKEFYHPMGESILTVQASRCMDCGVPFCQSNYGCPVENRIPEWNDLVTQKRWREALESLHATNNFPEFTGRLCPAPCESACVLGIHSDPVTIRTIECSIVDRGFENGWVVPVRPQSLTGKRVAVVGSGPAGLAAAQQLTRAGHTVTVFEKEDRIGGLLRYGIPDFKLEKKILDRRLDQMIHEGVTFQTDCEIGRDITIEELQKRFHAICLTIGAEEPRELPIPGRELQGVHRAMDFLIQQNRRVSGARVRSRAAAANSVTAEGKRVVIIGGGDTGSDCLGTALRQGALEVHQFEILPCPPQKRSESTPWPLWPLQLRSSHAHKEGGERHWSISTTEFVGENGKLRGLRGVEVSQSGSGFVPIPGSEFELPAELIILALGFQGPRRGGLQEKLGVKLDSRGNIQTDTAYRTSLPGIFAAGDARRGASLIVWAIAEGRKMAASVDAFLRVPVQQAIHS